MNAFYLLSLLALLNICQELEIPKTPSYIPLAKSKEAKKFCIENDYNTGYCIFVNMSIHSGKNRLFVYQFNNDSIVSSGLCSHGCCDNEWGEDITKDNPKFSNKHESHCSSSGKYKIGKRGISSWGIKVNYQLHGLEDSNSNAFDRLIVLHSWDKIPEKETYPKGTPEGWGCPAVSNEQMRFLDNLLSKSKSPVLLWIFK